MKIRLIVVIAALWTASVLADTNINSYGNSGNSHSRNGYQDSAQNQNQASYYKALKDSNGRHHLQDKLDERGQRYQGTANQYGQANKKASSNGNAATQGFNKNDASFNEISDQINAAQQYTGHQSQSVGKYDKLDDNRAKGYTAANAKKNAYNRGKVFNDNISYGFDKKFSQDLSERGGFEEETGHRKHKLDDYRDKQKARKLIKGDHSATNARQDAQRALKENKYSQKAAQKQAATGRFGKSDKQLDKAGATQDAQSVLYDRKDSKYNQQEQGRQQAVNKANQFAGKDNVFGRQAAASKAGAQGHADKKYYGGHGDKGGTTGAGTGYKTGHAPSVGAGSHGHGSGGLAKNDYHEHAKQLDNGKEHLAQKAGASDAALKEYSQGKKKENFAQIKSLRDNRTGKFAQGVHNSDSKGYHDKNSHAAKTAAGADRKYADAAAQSNAKASKHDLDEQLFDKENFRRHQQDANENFKKLKRFYHDKKSGGNNYERLKYNRKRVENEFGSTQAAQKEHQNQFDKAHMSAKHNAAQRKDNYAKNKKVSRGYHLRNANKAASGNSAKKAHNFNKAAQKTSGHKKNVGESDYGNHRNNSQEKYQAKHDSTAGASGHNAEGNRKATIEQSENNGGSLSAKGGHASRLRGFGLSSAGKGYSGGIRANVGTIGNTNSGYGRNSGNAGYQSQGTGNRYQGSGNGNVGSSNNNGGYRGQGGNTYGSSGGSRYNQRNNYQGTGGRRISSGNGRGYGVSNTNNNNYNNNNNNNNNNGYSRRSRGNGISGGLFSSGFGLNNKGGLFSKGFSNYGNNYASRSGARDSVPHRGGLFTSSFGNSFPKQSTFRSSLRGRASFGFQPRYKGSLF